MTAAVELDESRPVRRLAAVPVDQINDQARKVEFGRTVLTVIAAVLYGLGFGVAKLLAVVWLAVCWAAVAVKVGWSDAMNPSRDDKDTA